MQLRLNARDEAFRREAELFFRHEYPADLIAKAASGGKLSREDHVRSQEALNAKGWLGLSWPVECGGTGWSPIQRYLFEKELEKAGAINIIPMGVIYIGPIICAFGTDAQKARWLPDILNSRSFWAQGYSEPEAGSDLASLRMTAVRDGEDYVLNGTKVWTSSGHWADWIFCLVRTSSETRKQEGISLVCVPMDAPGIRIDPIISIDGSHELNRVTFDNVRTSIDNRIGEEGRAWHYANVLLASERVSYAHIGRKRADLAALRACADELFATGSELSHARAGFLRRLADCEIQTDMAEVSVLRALVSETGKAVVSSLKISCTQLAQSITELWLELVGFHASIGRDAAQNLGQNAHDSLYSLGARATASYLFERAQTIYGGTTEIQKSIIWRQISP